MSSILTLCSVVVLILVEKAPSKVMSCDVVNKCVKLLTRRKPKNICVAYTVCGMFTPPLHVMVLTLTSWVLKRIKKDENGTSHYALRGILTHLHPRPSGRSTSQWESSQLQPITALYKVSIAGQLPVVTLPVRLLRRTRVFCVSCDWVFRACPWTIKLQGTLTRCEVDEEECYQLPGVLRLTDWYPAHLPQ